MPRFNFETTGIGSLPFKDPKRSCGIIFDNFKHIPFWPQLPRLSYKEQMYCQFSEGIPGLKLDEKSKNIYIDTEKAASQTEKAYQKYLDGDLEYFKIGQDYAAGFYEFLKYFRTNSPESLAVKGHITGPASFALCVTDQEKRALIYNRDMFDVIVKVLSMKAKWQIRSLKELKKEVIIFIDEPYLVSIGSSYVNVPMEDVRQGLDEVINSIKSEGALSGIHCCGNTDWSFILKTGVDIINFDAYNFIKEFALYTKEIKAFVDRGGTIAWGIVPSSEAIEKETGETIFKRLKDCIKMLSDKGIAEEILSSLVTPSCGLGTLDEDKAEKIIKLLNNIKYK